MSINPAVKVGILVVTAALLFFGAYMFLNENIRNAYSVKVVFDDIMGMTEGSAINMSGVSIGSIKKITLNDDLKAVAEININSKYAIPKGSRFILRVGLLIGEKFIDVIPNKESKRIIKPGATIIGETPTRIEDLIPKAEKIMTNLSNASDSVLPQTKELVTNLNAISKDLRKLLSDQNLNARLDRIFKNIEVATSTLEETLNAVKGIVVTNEDELNAILTNTKQASLSFRDAAKGLADFTKDPSLKSGMSITLASIKSSTESMQRSMTSLERTITSLEDLTTSPQMHEDIKASVAGTRKVVEQTNDILGKVDGLFGKRKDGEPLFKPRLPKLNTTIDSIYRPDDGRLRVTLETKLKLRKSGLNLGVYDLGGSNHLIAQTVTSIGSGTYARIGMYASTLGVGLDKQFSKRVFGTIDFYDPAKTKLDLKFGYRINPEWSMLLGVDDLAANNQLTFGVRVKR